VPPLPRLRERLARRAAREQSNLAVRDPARREDVGGALCVDVAGRQLLPAGPVEAQGLTAVIVDLDAPGNLESGPLKANVETAGAGEQRQDLHDAACRMRAHNVTLTYYTSPGGRSKARSLTTGVSIP